jgi:hypothetical protein
MSKHPSALSRLLTFSIIEDAPVAAISPDYFFRKFEDPVEWNKLSHEMDLYFFDRIEFFPLVERSRHHIDLHHFIPRRGRKINKYGHGGAKAAVSVEDAEVPVVALDQPSSTAETATPRVGADHPAPESRPLHMQADEPRERLMRPRRYFEIETELIERRFPADADIRQHFKTLRSYFCHNLIRYLTYKRLILLAVIALFLGLVLSYDTLYGIFIGTFFPGLYHAGQTSTTTALLLRIGYVAASFILAALIDLALNSVLFDRFKHATEQSCFHVSTIAISRTEKLRNCFDNCLKRIDEEQRQRSFDSDLADRAGRWIVLVYWLAKRLEDFERFALVELWRIRRINYWINLLVRLLTLLGAAIVLALLAHWIMQTQLAGDVQTAKGLMAVFVLTIALVVLNYTTWRASVRLVRDSMKSQDWARYADLELQEEFRHQIYEDKSEILRWYAQFQGLVRGTH